MRAFLALPRIEQNELLNPLQLFDELFHGKIAPGGFGLAMHILQHRDAQHAVKGVDADLAVGPVMHRSPTEPLSVFQAAEDALHLLLAGITGHHLFRGPVQAVGEQHRAAYTTTEQALNSGLIEIKLETPWVVERCQLIVNYVMVELSGQYS